MLTTIDRAGRLVIPKPLRARLGLGGGAQVEIRERNGLLEIEPTTTSLELTTRGCVLVAVPADDCDPLTDDDVRLAIEQTRR